MLDWRVDTFLDVCETLNYTHTAKRLNITQPAVSQHIAWIENQLGTTLFVRTGRSLRLNEAGRLAKEVLQTQKHDEMLLRQEIAALKTSAFTLSIGATLTAGEHLLAHPLALWCKDRPQVKASVSIADTAKLLSLLDKGEIDCALVEGIFDSNKYAWQRWSRERMVCVKGPTNLSAQNASSKRKTLSFREILEETLIIREEGSGSRAVLEAALARHNLAPESFERVVEAKSLRVALEMTAVGLGITLAYEPAVKEDLAQGKLIELPLDEEGLDHDICFVWQRTSTFAKRYLQLFHELRSYCRE